MDIDELDPATRAFEALRQEVRALGEKIDNQLVATEHTTGRLAAIEASLSSIAGPTADAARQQSTLAGLVEELQKERDATRSERSALQAARAQVRGSRDLTRWIAGAGNVIFGGALAVALIIGSLRVAPDEWLWPERVAARLLNGSMWDGGTRMLSQADLAAWNQMAEGYHLIGANRAAYERCRRTAERAKSEMPCKLKVKPPEGAATLQ